MRKYVVIVREGEQEVRRQVLFVGSYAFLPGKAGLQDGSLQELRASNAPEMPERLL
ncbi:MAG TPA: hypothetical protein PKV72_06975 [Candidatus Peribacteria bacterium]|nr:hypothetical protein [Candidatus Peribacteria bacterium]